MPIQMPAQAIPQISLHTNQNSLKFNESSSLTQVAAAPANNETYASAFTASDMKTAAPKPHLEKINSAVQAIKNQQQQAHQCIKDWVMKAPEAESRQRLKFMHLLNSTPHVILGDLLKIDGNLDLQGFDQLTSLPEINIEVSGHAHFEGCRSLESISNLTVHENLWAQNCESLRSMTNVQVDYAVNLSGCKSLKEMPECLHRVRGSLNISHTGIGSLEGVRVSNCIYATDKPHLQQVSDYSNFR